MVLRYGALIVASLLTLSPQAQVFEDDFDTEGPPALNYSGFTNFTVAEGFVDLLGGSSFGALCVAAGAATTSDQCVDLDGTGANGGTLVSAPISLTGGQTYRLEFNLAGSQRGNGFDEVTVTFGAVALAPISLPPGQGFTRFRLDYTPSSDENATVTFAEAGNDNVGHLLDDVLVADLSNLPPVPIGIADGDIVEVTVDQTETINFSFTSPEAGQTTTITFAEVVPDSFNDNFTFTTTPGNPATAQVDFSVFNGTGGAPTGDYDFEIVATDNGAPAASTTIQITVQVRYPPTKSCGFGVDFYINRFHASPTENFFQLYSTESGLVDLTGCSFVAFDATTETIVVSEPLTATLFPFGEPQFHAGTAFTGLIPSGPGAIALVLGTPSVGDDVASVLGDVVNAIVYYNDGGGTFDTTNIFGICGAGTLLGGVVPHVPCDSAEASSMLSRLGQAVSSDADLESGFALTAAPNPVHAAATVTFDLAAAGDVRVALYDALGREVAVVADGPHGPGRHTAALDAAALPAGVYVVRAVAGAEVRTAPITIVR